LIVYNKIAVYVKVIDGALLIYSLEIYEWGYLLVSKQVICVNCGKMFYLITGEGYSVL